MRTIEQIDSEILKLKEELTILEGTKTEIYSRIVGYYRSVRNWNKGKKEEFRLRTAYCAEGVRASSDDQAADGETAAAAASIAARPVTIAQPVAVANSASANSAVGILRNGIGVGRAARSSDEGLPSDAVSAASYVYFFRKTCPNCPPVRHYVETLSLSGAHIDVDESEGMQLAAHRQVSAAPTVIFFDHAGEELYRTHTLQGLKSFLASSMKTAVNV